MAAFSEVGHAKNVANFEDLINTCTGYGATYNPVNTALQISALTAQYTNADNLIDNVVTATDNYNKAVGIRQAEFEPLQKFATKLVNAYIAVNPSKQNIANAKTINVKVVPVSTGPTTEKIIAPPVVETPKDISASQQSYDQLVEHFSKLVTLLSADPLFLPNEVPLQSASLNAKLIALKTSNTNFGIAYTAVTNTRIARDHALYDKTVGLCDTAQTVKAYVKSVYGASSPEFKMINKIQFKSRTKK
jgi:hypothetical protein